MTSLAPTASRRLLRARDGRGRLFLLDASTTPATGTSVVPTAAVGMAGGATALAGVWFFIFGGAGIYLLATGSALAGIGLMGVALFGGALMEA